MDELRDYQAQAIADLRAELARMGKDGTAKRALLIAPTGAGKTVMAAAIIRGAIGKGKPVLFLAHAEELISQASRRLTREGITHGVIKAGWKACPEAQVQVASVQTLRNRQKPPAAIVIVDEAHRTLAKSYLDILESYPDATIIGLTATPIRMDGKGLGEVYRAMVQAATIEELIALGVLVKPRVFAPTTPDLSSVKSKAGDYDERQINDLMNRPSLVGNIVEHWFDLAQHQRTVVFASNVQHSKNLRDAFRAAGVVAEHIDGTTPAAERTAILQGLEDGTVTVVCNCAVLTEGWDCPPVAVAVLARPTQSLSLYLQMVGRILRPAEGKTGAIVIDHAGCTHEHGMAHEPRQWELTTGKVKPPAPSVKNCPECYAVMASSAKTCAECSYEWTTEQIEREIRHDQARRLAEIEKADPWHYWPPNLRHLKPKGRKATTEEKSRVYQHFLAFARRKGYDSGWAAHRYQSLFKAWPQRNKLLSA